MILVRQARSGLQIACQSACLRAALVVWLLQLQGLRLDGPPCKKRARLRTEGGIVFAEGYPLGTGTGVGGCGRLMPNL